MFHRMLWRDTKKAREYRSFALIYVCLYVIYFRRCRPATSSNHVQPSIFKEQLVLKRHISWSIIIPSHGIKKSSIRVCMQIIISTTLAAFSTNGVIILCRTPKPQFKPTQMGFACLTEAYNASPVCPDNVRSEWSNTVPECISKPLISNNYPIP